jgi:maltokinase
VEVPAYLEPWMIRQRWFAGKGRAARLQVLGGFLLDAGPGVTARVHLVLDSAENPLLYQVPLTERRQPLPNADAALVAVTRDEEGEVYVYDGPHDPSFAAALLRLMLDESAVVAEDGSGRVAAFGHRDLVGDIRLRSSRVLSGEQSNTSIIFETTDGDGEAELPVIAKLFRAIHDGENPDVVLTAALGAAGSTVVPRSVGHVTGRWPDIGKLDGMATGHLAFAQEFLPGVEDAWRVATSAAAADEDFSERAFALGSATAEMHETLARALPSRATTPADIALIVGAMRARFDEAAREVPALAAYRDQLERVYRAAQESPWPPLQRIHGDFHLGQVLAVPGRGWVVLDFEGEPLRAMRERTAPDSPLRDVAGMLRSFDYVAGSHELTTEGGSVADWASAARQAFLDGYIDRSGRDLRTHRALLDAFEIDKALYEAVYEARNRPAWLSIPTTAIDRLVER